MNYTFKELNSYDFELLVRDLLNEEYRILKKYNHGIDELESILQFSSFKKGKDRGIDLLFRMNHHKTSELINVVVQVKHFTTSFSQLMSSIKKKINGKNELDKVVSLNPNKYIFVTSLPLSLHNKETLKSYFSPFIHTVNDVYGKEDLNKLLAQFERIEKRHIKLYLNSSESLERLFDNSLLIKSKFELEYIANKIPLFVQTESFFNALDILENNKVVIINGPPGGGKSILAEMLCINLIDKGFGFYYIDSTDAELEKIIEKNEKQIFYFDDFLGANFFNLSNYNFGESRIGRLVRIISQSSTKRLVMTTRTNILKKANFQSEKISRLTRRINKLTIDVESYTIGEKEQIYFSHIEYYTKNELLKRYLINESVSSLIINHRNYSPRLIEYLIRDFIPSYNKKDGLIDRIIHSLDCPNEIWFSAYRNQLNNIDRAFLTTLFMFDNYVENDIFEFAFENRIKYEITNNHYQSSYNEYKESINHLDGSFISVDKSFNYQKELFDVQLKLINPSIVDFLGKQFIENKNELLAGIKSFVSAEQLVNKFNHKKKDFLLFFKDYNELDDFFSKEEIINRIRLFDFTDIADLLTALLNYFHVNRLSTIFKEAIDKIELISFVSNYNPIDTCSYLISLHGIESFRDNVLKNWDRIFIGISEGVHLEDELEWFLEFLDEYDYSIDEITDSKLLSRSFKSAYERVLVDTINQRIFEYQDDLLNWEEVNKLMDRILNELSGKYISNKSIHEEVMSKILNDVDWNSVIKHSNYLRNGEYDT